MATISRLTGEDVSSRYEALDSGRVGPLFTEYHGSDRLLGRPICARVLNPVLASEAVIDALSSEMIRVSHLTHPGVERVLDIVTVRNTLGIMVEPRRGAGLDQRIRKIGAFPVPYALDVVVTIAETLQAAHRDGVFHGNLCLSDVTLTSSGVVKVLDLGIITALASVPAADRPVEFRTVRPPTAAADARALGLLLYQLVSGNAEAESADVRTSAGSPLTHVPPAVGDLAACLAAGAAGYTSVDDSLRGLKQIRDAIRYGRPMPDIAPVRPADTFPKKSRAPRTAVVPAGGPELLEPLPVRSRSGSAKTRDPGEAVIRTRPGMPSSMQRVRSRSGAPRRSLGRRILRDFMGLMVLCLLAALAALGGFIYVNWFAATPEVAVPQLWGKTQDEARTELERLHLKMQVDPSRTYDPAVEPDHVLRQTPPAGQHTKAPRTITLFLSAGSRTVRMPAVEGKPLEQVLAMLKQAGLRCTNNGQVSSPTVPYGDVARQWPPAGSEMPRGSQTFIRVSGGPSEQDLLSGTSDAPQSRTVSLQVPHDAAPGKSHSVELREVDLLGNEHLLWKGQAKAGDLVQHDVTIDAFNDLRIYLDGKVIKSRSDGSHAGSPGDSGAPGDSGTAGGSGPAGGTKPGSDDNVEQQSRPTAMMPAVHAPAHGAGWGSRVHRTHYHWHHRKDTHSTGSTQPHDHPSSRPPDSTDTTTSR